ncbi:MAG: tRNA lysidine(34) synthetase TilS [Spirochaetales bacterium]|nr:tRNA lysidine(34) synthetase TilS [Spirochaetales bacterium]
MEKISQKISDFLGSLDSHTLDKGLLVACSGGRDSMVLLDILHKTIHGKRLGVLYVNHNLRGEDSAAEEAFVRKTIIEKYKLPLFIRIIDANEWHNCGSIENKARDIRYTFFAEILQREKYGFVATAHHMNDRIETFFLNLLRGANIQSLSSIPAVNHDIVRPMLTVTREEIDTYAHIFSVEYVEDKTNSLPLYKRNRIRNEVIPLLKTLSGNLEASFSAVFAILDTDVQFLEQEISARLENVLFHRYRNVWCIDRRKFSAEHAAVRSGIVKKICYGFNVRPGRQLTEYIANAQTVNVKKNDMLIQSKGPYLWFYPHTICYNPQFSVINGKYKRGDFAFSSESGDLEMRTISGNDEIDTPNGRKNIADILKKRGVPETVARSAKVFHCGSGQVAGYFCFGFFGVSQHFYAKQNETAHIFYLNRL